MLQIEMNLLMLCMHIRLAVIELLHMERQPERHTDPGKLIGTVL